MNINKTLLYKNRSLDGYNLIEEETLDDQPINPANKTNKPYMVKLCSITVDRESILKQRSSLYEEQLNYSDKDFSEKFQNCSTK